MLQNEGGYVNDKNDRGGETNLGISENFLIDVKNRHKEYINLQIKTLTLDQAKELYHRFFWVPFSYDKFKKDSIAIKSFDIGVNIGGKSVIKLLQKSINRLTIGQYKELEIDGDVGGATLLALSYCDEKPLYLAFLANIIAYYSNLKVHSSFRKGLMNRAKKNVNMQTYLWTK
ncbi:MAG: hypothetical protein EKK56_00890 [Flavobacteriaceae bacterium]|nr:MAG: hypothetical protein EKK56_00890 [Flavobacteriaceae bacterium]